ncbi:flagellar basal body P-ring formation chaperone FlgA [Roseinatronobacter monicus]|uniref:Flagella basal body P-ring formation protein FlgA n=1 Tax=Roseinatronobacter monicus TaxID=393481 RepID=A0A543KE55_9RHOB|nr:flagellar basal body P-ring formation chaperone FlgA [Roseinatronobacter monicus]TQM93352.1 flagella basal body P-ring formation protein FlgA [Roseinatronobacter monicus]
MKWLLMVFILIPPMALADSLVATRLIRATDVITSGDVVAHGARVPGAATAPDQVIGLEARVAIYPGRPVRLSDLGPAAVIERNEIVRMVYRQGPLMILSEGRALARAGLGDALTVMNLASRQSVQGVVTSAGLVAVGTSAPAIGGN